MEMTFEEYIANPMGRNNAVLRASTREMIRKEYTVKFDNLMLRENGKVEYHLYRDKNNNIFWAHIKVPSETVKEFYYDVVLKFYATKNVDGAGRDLFKYNVQFYSNDPSFVYTYAHVFLKNGLFIRELSSKMSKEALRKEAKEKNPSGDVGYVKSLYFAYLIMQNRGLNKLSKFEPESGQLDPKMLLASIMDADEKIALRQEEGSKVSKRKKIEVDKTTLRNMSRHFNSDTDTSALQIRTTKRIGTIKPKTSVNSVKAVKTTKRK